MQQESATPAHDDRDAVDDDAEKGYVMAVTALMLIPMLVFTAFATDVGAWYVRAQEIQRAADAAALAAVVWMPDDTVAATVAVDVAGRNGFVDQPGDFDDATADLPQVQVTQVGSQRVRVDIRAEGDLYFGSVIESFEPPAITRFATAEYILPVPMGNPTSALGTGVDTAYGIVDNFHLVSNGRCDRRRNGDFISSEHSRACNERDQNGEFNPMYDASGHAFVVDVPADPTNGDLPAASWELQIRMTCYDNGPNDMEVTVFPADDTPLNDYDNEDFTALAGPTQFNQTNCTNGGNPGDTTSDWRRAGVSAGDAVTGTGDDAPWQDVITFTEPGRHVIRLRNPSNDTNNANRGRYSLRVKATGVADNGRWACSRIANPVPAVTVTPTCPAIYARDWMTVRTDSSMLPDGTTEATLYLAAIEEVHAGKTLQITLFDAADGIDYVQVIDPAGNPIDLEWNTVDNSDFGYGQNGGNDLFNPLVDSTTTYDQTCNTPTGTEPCLRDPQGNNFMQDRTLLMQVELPNDYSCVDDGVNPVDCWWKVKYVDNNGSIGEVTTWNVRVIGDPVRLIE
ncbi:MAG: pilus assembly protein TadG-related protein [Acidimicrobiales bacterium]